MARKVTAELEIKIKDSASVPARRVQDSARKMGKSLENAGASTVKAQGKLSKFASFLKSNFLISLGAAAVAVAGIFNAIKASSDLSGTTTALKLSLAKQGQDFDTYISKLQQVSRGTVSTADLIKSSSKALLLGIPAEEISKLLEIARVSSIATGQTVTAAFDDIAVGIGRTSPLILDNLGIVVKIGRANEVYAKKLGIASKAMTGAQQKQALLNAVLLQGEKRIAEFGEAADSTSIALQQGQAAMADFKIVIGTGFSALLNGITAGFLGLAVAIIETRIAAADFSLKFRKVFGSEESIKGQRRAIKELKDLSFSLQKTGNALLRASSAQFNKLIGTTAEKAKVAAKEVDELADSVDDVAEAANQAADALNENAAAVSAVGDESEKVSTISKSSLLPALQSIKDQLENNTAAANNNASANMRLAESQQALSNFTGAGVAQTPGIGARDQTGRTVSQGRVNIFVDGRFVGTRLVGNTPPAFSNISANGNRRDTNFSRV